MSKWVFLMIALVLNAGANVLMKVGARSAELHPLAEGASLPQKVFHFLNLATVAGILLFGANVLFYRKALDRLDISVAYPIMTSGGFVLVAVAAVMLPILSEKIGLGQAAGMALIAVGVWLVARGQGG